MDREIAEIENKIQGQRKAMGGVHNSHLRHLTTSHTIKVLENRLDKATREFNSLTADNSKLRGEIQHLRNQRGVFDNIFKRLRKEMGHKKHEQVSIYENISEKLYGNAQMEEHFLSKKFSMKKYFVEKSF